MVQTCTTCGSPFEITNDDLAFYDKVSPVFGGRKYSIPPPTLCPECRRQRRLVWHNLMKLYNRKCDMSGRNIISNVSSDKPHIVYDINEWWSDSWDQNASGMDFDFNRAFFEQFNELLLSAPIPSLHAQPSSDENCTYTNYAMFNKNCYLIFHANGNEDCMYGFGIKFDKNCLDTLNVFNSELHYECIDCENCYNLQCCQDCENCSDSLLLNDCIGCTNCIACHNLRNAEYHAFNKKITREELEDIRSSILDGSFKTLEEWRNRFASFLMTHPHRAAVIRQCEDCSGDHIFRCQNVRESFDVKDTRDGKFLNRIFNGPNSDLYDVYQFGVKTEMCYECSVVGINAFKLSFCALCRNEISDMLYCFYCQTCNNCLGCVGLHNKEYCILNKQYSKEEYEELSSKIIEHMIGTKEYGEFFPANLSPFAYNETIAIEQYPMTKEEVESKGWNWRKRDDETPNAEKIIPADQLPDNISDIPDDLLNWAIKCEFSSKLFIIQKKELEFYRRMKIPIPHLHPDERYKRRVAMRNPRRLWKKKCDKCGREMETTYHPSRLEKVYCEECYLREVY